MVGKAGSRGGCLKKRKAETSLQTMSIIKGKNKGENKKSVIIG